MGRVRLLVVSLVALVLALGAAFAARTFAAPRQPKVTVVPATKPTVQVLTARKDLAVGDRIDPGSMLQWQSWPADALSPSNPYVTQGAATSAPADGSARIAAAAGAAIGAARTAVAGPDAKMAAYAGAVVREPIAAGEPIIDSKLVRAGAGGVMAVTLQPGMRAMSIPLTADNAAGGFILPGDHVDVVQVRRAEGVVVSSTVMKNVRVLAIDKSTSATAANQAGASATLELDPGQAEDMVLARAQGDLTLVLRSYADAAGPTNTGDVHRMAEQSPVVRVFRGGQATEVKVAR